MGALSSRNKKMKRALHAFRVYLLSGFITFIVLRNTIGAGKFGTPIQDLNAITHHLLKHKHPNRLLSDKPYSFGLNTFAWTLQRELSIKNNPYHRSPNIHLITDSQITPCDSFVEGGYLLKSLQNKIDYCHLHAIPIVYNMTHLDDEMTGFWEKLPLLRKYMLTNPGVEWIWWMDSDAMFPSMTFQLPISKYSAYNIVLNGWNELVYEEKLWSGLNTGSFLLRNCQWSLDFVDVWAQIRSKVEVEEQAGKLFARFMDGKHEFEADDQSALIYLLNVQRWKWGNKVYLESSYYFHGYWAILVEKYEEIMEKHHLWLSGKFADYASYQCLNQMERVFNFAHNHILFQL